MRYGASALAGDRGYTGQRLDSTLGLTYFNARYYDQDVGAFTSADTYDAGGLNRYAYVGGDPETRTDPSGHCWPFCSFVAAVAFVAVGLAIASTTVVTAAVSGNLTAGTWARAGADVALGAAAAVAVTANPVGAGLGAIGGGIGVIGQLVAGQQVDLQSAFESVAVGAVAGAVGASAAGSLVATGARTATQVVGNILIQGATQGLTVPVLIGQRSRLITLTPP